MKNKILTIFIFGMFLFSMTSVMALECAGTGKQNQNYSIPQVCGSSTYVTLLTIQYPNKSIEAINTNMTSSGGGAFYYIFSDTSQLGRYDYCGITDGCENTFCSCFEITPSGKSFSQGQSTAGFGIIIGALAIAFFFMFFGFKLSENEKLFPLTILFMLLSFLFIVYSLHLSYVYTVDILQYESLGNVSSVIYVSILWILVSVAVLSVILILVSSIKAMGEAAKKKQYGEGFNPVTNTYDF